MIRFFAALPPCLIAIEACAGAHYRARELGRLGHDARLMAAQFVIPWCRSGKNDANDAEAICDAVGRPSIRFVPVKSEEVQAILTLHQARDLLVSERVSLSNQIKGLLGEFGIPVACGMEKLGVTMLGIQLGKGVLPLLPSE